ncbi:VPS11 [Auxenochlorella protothecoides x Auxenochlorella symbiontica]
MAAFKRYRFYDALIKNDTGLPDTVTCAVQDEALQLFLGCSDGTVICLHADLSLKATLPSHAGPVHAIACYDHDVLCTVGEEGAGTPSLTLKIWNGREGSGAPTNPLVARLFANKSPPSDAVAAADIHVSALEWPNLHVAVALSSGALHISRFDKGKLRCAGLPCSPLHLSSEDREATFLAFARTPAASLLWATTRSATAAWRLPRGDRALQEPSGAEPRRATLSSATQLAVAGAEAVLSFDVEHGQTGALALPGPKAWLAGAGSHLAVASPEAGTGAASAGVNGTVSLRLLDPANRVLAGSAELAGPLRWLAATAAGVAAGTADGGVAALRPLPLRARLAVLYRTRAYALALALARSERADAATLAEVRLQYADALYAKRDYDAALEQYLGTMGHLEPSYVIQRFLSVQRLANLTTYLEKLHAAGLGSPDHTTLLLNCYTKLGDGAKLDAFIAGAGDGAGAPAFDVAAVVQVCRAAGYFSHALAVARAAGDDTTYLDVLLEDCGRWDEGLDHMRGMGRRAAAAALLKHGKGLLAHVPVETTALVMELCVPPSGAATRDADADGDAGPVASLADYTHLYADRPEDLRYACLTIINMGGAGAQAQRSLYRTLLDLYLAGLPGQAGQQDALDLLKRGWPPGGPPAYDVDQALVSCRGRGFAPGLVFLFEASGLYREAAGVLRAAGDAAGLLALCERRGDARQGGDATLWRDALEHFARLPDGEESAARVRGVLQHVEARALLPPLQVLHILAQNPALRLDLVKGYVSRQLEADNRAMAADVEEAERLEEEVERARLALERLRSEPVVFQSNRDAATGAALELPSVHFMCGHSFNARTLGDDGGGGGAGAEPGCPLCAPEHARTAALVDSNRAWAADKDAFFKQLRAAPDGFAVVTEYLGKGVLNASSVSVDAGGEGR